MDGNGLCPSLNARKTRISKTMRNTITMNAYRFFIMLEWGVNILVVYANDEESAIEIIQIIHRVSKSQINGI